VPDLRYHLISLISVFLALAIGILLGVAMADRGVVDSRVQAEITSIRQQLDRQRNEIDKQNDEIAEQEVMLERMSDTLIAESLQGEDVALVVGPYANPDVRRALESDLSEAGANITTVFSLGLPDPDEITGQELTTREATTQLESGYAVDAAHEVLGYTEQERDTPEVVIFVGGGEIPEDAPPGTLNALKGVERKVFEIWLDAGVRVVGAQPSDARRTEIPLFRNVGIPSVDNADQPAGRAAVIECAAMEDCEGTYGIKNSASEPFPPPS
jgi:copper transport outer membrane protein MctB